MRIAYQMPVMIEYAGEIHEAIPSTFEDSLVYTNFSLFSSKTGEGLMKNIYDACNEGLDFTSFHEKIYNLFRGKDVPKAGFALDLIYSVDPQELQVPNYINEGLLWLQDLLDKLSLSQTYPLEQMVVQSQRKFRHPVYLLLLFSH